MSVPRRQRRRAWSLRGLCSPEGLFRLAVIIAFLFLFSHIAGLRGFVDDVTKRLMGGRASLWAVGLGGWYVAMYLLFSVGAGILTVAAGIFFLLHVIYRSVQRGPAVPDAEASERKDRDNEGTS